MNYKISYCYTAYATEEVEAESEDEAKKIITDMYSDGLIGAGELTEADDFTVLEIKEDDYEEE